MTAMTTEAGNLRVAWRFWTAESDLGQLTKLADSLLIVNEARGWYHDTVELTTDLLAVLARTTSTPELVGQEVALRMSLARALMATKGYTPEVAEAYTHVLELFERGGGEIRQHYSVMRGLASLYLLRTEFDRAAALGKRILAFGEQEDDPNMRVDGHLVVGSTFAFSGDLRDGLAHLDAAIELFEANPGRTLGSRLGNDPRVACLTTSGFILWLLGFPDRAVERADSAIELARGLGHPYTSAYAQFHSGLLHHWRREPEVVLDRALRLLGIADEYDFRIWAAVGGCLLGAAQVDLGRFEEGLANIRDGLAAYRGIVSPPVFWPMLLYLHARASGLAGHPGTGPRADRDGDRADGRPAVAQRHGPQPAPGPGRPPRGSRGGRDSRPVIVDCDIRRGGGDGTSTRSTDFGAARPHASLAVGLGRGTRRLDRRPAVGARDVHRRVPDGRSDRGP